jgi:predicted RNA-binding Zn-ribbon protein involved in translation (DUF1610 family)
MKTTNYDDAVKTVAENLSGMDLFEASILLARLFDVDKKRTMDDLDQLDNDRRAQVKAANQVNTDSQERIGKLACPECGGESITMFRSARVTSTHKVSVVDGRIDAAHMIEEKTGEPTGITFMCEICRHRWDAPDWVLKLVNWDSDDSPIPYSLTNSGRVAAEVVEDEDDED